MSTFLKYAILLALAVAIGFYAFGPVSLEDIGRVPAKRQAAAPVAPASIDEELDYLVAKRLGSLEGWRAFLAAHGSGVYAQSARAEVERLLPAGKAVAEATVAPVAPVASASIDEELDYRVAQRLGSREGWRAFLAAHGSGVYAQSARAEVETLLRPEKALAPARAAVSYGASPDAKAVSEAVGPAPPSPATRAAPLTPDAVCKRDEDRLARLRSRPSIDEAERFAVELGCQKLWPQLLGLMESLGNAAPAPPAAEVSNGASPDAKAVSEAADPTPPLAGAEVAALTPDEVCKRDEDRLARLRSRPSIDEAERFAVELGCRKLWPQVLGLMESSGNASPAPAAAEVSNGTSPDAKSGSEAVGPAPPRAGTEAATLTSDEVCKRDEGRLARLRGSPSSEEAGRFANELGCEKLRPEVLGLMESLGNSAPAPAAAEVPLPVSVPTFLVQHDLVTSSHDDVFHQPSVGASSPYAAAPAPPRAAPDQSVDVALPPILARRAPTAPDGPTALSAEQLGAAGNGERAALSLDAAASAPPSAAADQNVDVAAPTILARAAPDAPDRASAPVVAGLPTLAPVRVVLNMARDDAGRRGRAADIQRALAAAGFEVADLVPVEPQRPGPTIGYYFQSDRNAAAEVSHLLEPLLGAVDPVAIRKRGSIPEPGTIEIAIP